MDRRRELAVMQIDFNAVFDRVRQFELLFKLSDVGVHDIVFNAVASFIIGIDQIVLVAGVCSEDVWVVSGVPHG